MKTLVKLNRSIWLRIMKFRRMNLIYRVMHNIFFLCSLWINYAYRKQFLQNEYLKSQITEKCFQMQESKKMRFNFIKINANVFAISEFQVSSLHSTLTTSPILGCLTFFFSFFPSNVIIVYYRAITAKALVHLCFRKATGIWWFKWQLHLLLFFCRRRLNIFLQIKHVSHTQFACEIQFLVCHIPLHIK